MRSLLLFVAGLLISGECPAGTCRVEQVRFTNIDVEEISRRYRVEDADTFPECLKKSLDGQLRGTSYLRYTEEKDGREVSYLLYFGQVKQLL